MRILAGQNTGQFSVDAAREHLINTKLKECNSFASYMVIVVNATPYFA